MNTDRTREMLRKVRQIEIRTNHLVTDSLVGHYHSVFKGRGMDFDEVREYEPGDDVRAIDWNVTAREGRPYIKKFVEERELTLVLLVDVSASGQFGSVEQNKRELAAEIASVLAFSALRNQDKVGLVLFSDQIEQYIPPNKGRRHVLRVLREILYFTPAHHGTRLNAALDFVNDITRRRAVVFCISDFQFSEPSAQAQIDFRRALRRTSRRHDLVAVRIHDRHETMLPDVGLLTLEDAETGEMLEINTHAPEVRDQFADFARLQYDLLRGAFHAEGIDHLNLSTADAYLPPLIQFFKGRERRRR